MIEDPGLFLEFEKFFVEYNSIIGEAIIEAGASAIWMGDCVATSYFISPAQYLDLAASPAAELSSRIRAKGGVVFYHGGEISIPHLEIASNLPFDAVNTGYGVKYLK